jgi:hypothetical protein
MRETSFRGDKRRRYCRRASVLRWVVGNGVESVDGGGEEHGAEWSEEKRRVSLAVGVWRVEKRARLGLVGENKRREVNAG